MNSMSSIESFATNVGSPVTITAPTNLTILSTSSTAIYISWTASILTNGSGLFYYLTTSPASSTFTTTSTSIKLTDLTASTTYTVSITASCDQGVFSTTPTIQAQTLSSQVVMDMSATSGVISYSADSAFTTSTTDVNSGTNFIARSTGLTTSVSSPKYTYLNLKLFSKSIFQNTNITFYHKFKINNIANSDRPVTWAQSISSGLVSNYLSVAYANGKTNSAYYDPNTTKVYDGTTTTTWIGSVIQNLFIMFSSTGTHRMTMINASGNIMFNVTASINSSTVMSNYLRYTLGRTMFSSLDCCTLVTYYVNTYNKILSDSEMTELVNNSYDSISLT